MELTAQERQYVETLLVRRHDELLHELHHAVTHEYKEGLKKELALTEDLRIKLAGQ